MYSNFPVTSASLFALSASYGYDDKLNLKSKIYQFDNGYYISYNPIFRGTKDVAINKDTTFYISSAISINDFLSDFSQILGVFDLVIYTAIQIADGLYLTDVNDTLYATSTEIDENSFFRISRNSDNTITIYNKDYKVATVDRNSPWNITFQNKFTRDTYNQQKFNFYLKGSNFYITTLFTSPYNLGPQKVERFWSYSPVNGIVRAIGTLTDDDYVPDNSYLFGFPAEYSSFLTSLTTGFIDAKIKWVNYDPFTTNINTISSIDDIKINYIVDNPYNTKISLDANNKVGQIDINIGNLKNIQTPEYEYATMPIMTDVQTTPAADFVKRREYEKIFLGTNQQNGYESPYLGFKAFTKEILLKKDKVTYFHYPKTAHQLYIANAGFIESGACPGSSPARADKIWKKMADYSRDIYWGDSQSWQRGIWLCSWLSGSDNINPNVKPIWMDRWYYPGYTTVVDALTAYETVYVEHNPIVWDEVSSMTMDQGVWYKYMHKGESINTDIINSLTGDGTNLKLWLRDWDDITTDLSIYENDGVLANNNILIDNEFLKLDGNNECMVPYSSSFGTTDDISVSIWTKSDNWNTIKNSHIVSNNFRGGWSIEYTNGFYNPIVSTYENSYGHLLPININDRFLFDRLIPNNGTCKKVLVDKNLYTWILDDTNNKLYKLDYTSDILKQLIFVANCKDIVLNKDNNICSLEDDDNVRIYSTNTNTINLLSTSAVQAGNNHIDVDSNNNIIVSNCDDECIDNNNIMWSISSNNIFKNNVLTLSGLSATNINCDSNNNIWVLADNTQFIKYTNDAVFVLSGIVSTNDVLSARSIGFTSEYNKTTQSQMDYTWIMQTADNIMYKYDSNGILVSKISMTNGIDLTQYLNHDKSLMQFESTGDFTGYNWHRKFKYIKNNKSDALQANLTIGSAATSYDLTLAYPASNLLNNEMYHLCLTYNSVSGLANFYINSTIVDTLTCEPLPIYHEYENGVIVGGNICKSLSIDKELSIDQYHYNGEVSDLKIYGIELNNSDVTSLYLDKHDFKDMKWNMLVGDQNYIEEVERFFKHKLPGMKSSFYNVKIAGLGIDNEEIKDNIETIIRGVIDKISPAHTTLYKVIWE